jgi:hypothetical protein
MPEDNSGERYLPATTTTVTTSHGLSHPSHEEGIFALSGIALLCDSAMRNSLWHLSIAVNRSIPCGFDYWRTMHWTEAWS